MLTIEKFELERYIAATSMRSATLGAQKALEMAGVTAPSLTINGAYKQYGKKRVQRWIDNKQVVPYREGSHKTSRVPITELLHAALGEEHYAFLERAGTRKNTRECTAENYTLER